MIHLWYELPNREQLYGGYYVDWFMVLALMPSTLCQCRWRVHAVEQGESRLTVYLEL